MLGLEQYEKAAELTRRMLDAARMHDWDELVSIGTARDAIFKQQLGALPQVSAQDKQKVAQLIEDILACHAEILDHAGPWLEHTATLLGAFDRTKDATVAAPQTASTEMK